MDHRLEIILAARDATKKSFQAVTGHVTALTKNIFSLRGAFATLAGTGGIGLFVKKSLDAADTIGKAADNIGISTDALQEYRHAARISGVSTELMDNSFKAFSKRVGEARNETGALVTFLKKFDEQLLKNIQSAGSTEDALDLVMDRMGRTAKQTDRAALAAAAFSRSGLVLANMVKDGAEGLRQMRQDARDLGIIMDEELIRNSEKANDEIEKLTRVLKVQFMSAAVGLAPEIARIAESTTDWWKANQGLVKINVAQYAERIKTALEKIWGVIQYDPAILEWGLVGLAIGGKKWGVIAGSMGHMSTWASNLAKALGLAAEGILDYSEIAKSNFAELDALVKKGEGRLGPTTGKIGPRTTGWEIYQPPKTGGPGGGGGAGTDMGDADAAKKEYEKLMDEVAKAQEDFQKSLIIPSGTFESMEQQLSRGVGESLIPYDATKEDMEKTREAFEAMYSDLKFQHEGYYNYRLAQLEKQAEDIEKYTGDELGAYQWLTEQIKALDKERLESAQTGNQYLIDLSQRTAEAMEQNFSDYYFDVMRGEFDDLGDYADAMLKSIQRATADVMGQMTKESLFGKEGSSGLVSETGSWLGSFFGGGKQHGGSVDPYKAYVVGESGPELLYMGSNRGHVVPSVGGGTSPKIQINVINQTGEKMTARQGSVRFDGKSYITDVHIDKMINSRSYRQANRSAMR